MNDQIIGKYRVLRQIGAGGMASVFLAVHQDVPSLHVVLKRLGDPDLVERFKREADKLAALDGHPGVCQIKHFFDHDGVFYIAMEYIDGQTLQDLVEAQGHLDLGRSLYLARTILDILETAHARGICHRDIKPTNLMIDKNDNLKIIDFGLAKAESDPHLTNIGTSLGSPLYMAPEQFNPREDLDSVRCDIYAVGITLYFMLTGQLPFSGRNLVQIIEAKTKEEIVPPSRHNPEIPAGLEAAILTAIARNPKDRFASVAEMKVALVSGPADRKAPLNRESVGEATVALGAGQLPAAGVTGPAGPSGGSRRPWRWLIPAAVLAAALAVIGGRAGLFGPGNQAPPSEPAVQADRTGPAGGTVPAPPGKLTLVIRPEGDIYLDGLLQGKGLALRTLALDGAPHTVRVDHPGSAEKTWSQEFRIGSGDSVVQEITFTAPAPAADTPPILEPAATTASAVMGELAVGSLPALGASIFINGEDTHHTTPYTLRLGAGEYRVKVVLTTDGTSQEQEESVLVKSGQSEKKIFRFN